MKNNRIVYSLYPFRVRQVSLTVFCRETDCNQTSFDLNHFWSIICRTYNTHDPFLLIDGFDSFSKPKQSSLTMETLTLLCITWHEYSSPIGSSRPRDPWEALLLVPSIHVTLEKLCDWLSPNSTLRNRQSVYPLHLTSVIDNILTKYTELLVFLYQV